ncbi:MAG: TonB-dependent receptor plug domain-containing protein [Planctomycetota bacterium]|jgi:outer membrane receptor protein involved in Fe transport
MMRTTGWILALLLTVPAAAQDEEQEVPAQPPPEKEKVITITATRVAREAFETPRAVTILDERRLAERGSLSAVDSLNDQIGIWVEKRTTTTSDPVMRGLSGSNLLGLIDGNTLSTLWGEGGWAGDDMYGKFEPEMIGRIEVVRGPASVLYGSNALGGVINFMTRDPIVDFPEEGYAWATRSKIVYASSADELRFREEVHFATPFARLLIGGSYRTLEDAQGGRGVGTMEPTNGRDRHFDAKALFKVGEKAMTTLTIQDMRREPVYRFYRPSQDNTNERTAVGALFEIEDPIEHLDRFEARLYYQDKTDERTWYTDATRGVRDREGVAKWKTIAGGFQGTAGLLEGHQLTAGFAFERDDGESPDDEQFTVTHFLGANAGQTLKDAPDSLWEDYGFYLQYDAQVLEQLSVNASFRWDYFKFDSDVDSEYQPPGAWPAENDDIEEKEKEPSGGIALLYAPREEVRVSASWFRGFRFWPPRFGATQHGWGVLVPTGTLSPITGDTYELGTKVRVPDMVEGSAFFYYTSFDNHQVIVPGTFQGSDWFDFNGNTVRDAMEDVYVTQGTGKAYVYGVELEGTLQPHALLEDIPPELSIRSGFMWNIGVERETDEPLRHTHPARFLLALRWDEPKAERPWWIELYAEAVRHYDRIATDRLINDVGYLDDPQDGASGLLRDNGLPGYTIYSMRGGVKIADMVDVTLSIENVTDKRFRRAHSRWDELGTNVLLGVEVRY